MWTIHGNSYDLTPLLHWHPGGAAILKFAYGTDCTALFESYHVFSEAPRTLLEQYGQPYAAKTSLWSFAARVFVQVASYALMLKYPTTLNAVAHGIVTEHGGTLEAQNRPEGGACFTLTLPGSERA